jgi:hemoglobin
MNDIASREDIKLLVDQFYGRVRNDDLLGPIFKKVIGDHWDSHLEKMYNFWHTVLLNEHRYQGSPFAPHLKLPIEKEHFDRWLSLFGETLDKNFEGEKADEAKWRSEKMAQMFQFKLDHFKNSTNTPIV